MIVLPVRTVGGLNAREHWRARAARVKKERGGAFLVVRMGACYPDSLPVVVTLTRLSAGTLDSDNLQGAMKAIRDGVADAYGVADNDPLITWKYEQERCARGNYGVRIEVEAA
jgi:hypothetical protein